MGVTEDETVGWYPQLYGHEFEQVPAVGDGQGILEWGIPCGSQRAGHN